MSDQVERKLQEVPVARYEYRHEAEFAAGFLDDAGIPFRLQVDDPALGISIGVSATIWVRGMDLERAREVLEIDDRPVSLSGRTQMRPRSPKPPAPRSAPSSPPERGRLTDDLSTAPLRFDTRERVVAFLLAAGGLGVGTGLVETGASEALGYVTVGVAAMLALVGILGRGPGIIRRLLNALAGNAP